MELTKEHLKIINDDGYTCSHCGKETLPIVTKVDEYNYKSNVTVINIRGGIGNKTRAKLCEECYEKAKIMLEKIKF